MFSTELSSKSKDRSSAQYVGGEVRDLSESSNIHIALAFEGANRQNGLALSIAQTMLGSNIFYYCRQQKSRKNSKKYP